MDLATWERQAPESLRDDALWRRQDYRLARYLADTAWPDVAELDRHGPTRDTAAQLYAAIGSIAANLAEGYSRGSAADRIRCYEYALGSAREAREWYARAAPVLGADRVAERCALRTSVVRLLLTVIPSERTKKDTRPFGRPATRPT